VDIPAFPTDTHPVLLYGVPAAVVALVVLSVLIRRWARNHQLARVVSTIATVLGLGWSAQGMWDAAVNGRYHVAVQVASILFIVFEAMLVSQMMKAHQYRIDRRRRSRFVRAVWVIASVMGLVVAFGEGLSQAPLRLAVPLLVAYAWWLDLTADDDPDERPETDWRWPPREIGLRIGLLRYTDADQRDPTAAERKRLADRIARLAFALEHGAPWMSGLLRRKIRLARLKLDADRAMLALVAERLRLSSAAIESEFSQRLAPEVRAVTRPEPSIVIKPLKPAESPALPEDRQALAYRLMRESVTLDSPRGMTAAELAALSGYGIRIAEKIAAEVRRERVNGHARRVDTIE
jgi:hypothetical protein